MPGTGSRNLYLLGMRGSGKSSVGPVVAQRLDWPFVDLDRLIEQREGLSIAQIFATHGEPYFRDQEQAALNEVAAGNEQVVALGGGAILRQENRELIRRTGHGVWLQACSEELQARIQADSASDSLRPRLTPLSLADELQVVAQERAMFYAECADFAVKTDRRSIPEIAEEIVQWWLAVDKDDAGPL